MTLEEFNGRYTALKPLTQEGVATYEARDVEGRTVLAHFVGRASHPAVERILDLVDRLPSADRDKVLDQIDVDGTCVLVTEVLDGFSELGRWLETRVGQDALAEGIERERHREKPDPDVLSEFTSLFGESVTAGGGPVEPARPPEPPRAPAAPPTKPTQPAAPAQPSEPGEFTRLFGTEQGTAPPAPPARQGQAPSFPAGPGTPGAGVDYRDRLQSTGGPPPPRAHPPKPPVGEPTQPVQGSEPGEFTRLFGKEEGKATPAAKPPERAGPAPSAPSMSGGSGSDYRDRLQSAGRNAPQTPSAPAQASGLPSGPGAYTRIVSAAPAQPTAAPSSAPRADESAPAAVKGRRTRDYVILAVVLVVVVVGAIALIVVALTGGGGEAPVGTP